MIPNAYPSKDLLVVLVYEPLPPCRTLFCNQEIDSKWSVQEKCILIFFICRYSLLYLFGAVNQHIRDGSRLNIVLEPDVKRPLIPFIEVVVESLFPA
jgi:hypothetical protein